MQPVTWLIEAAPSDGSARMLTKGAFVLPWQGLPSSAENMISVSSSIRRCSVGGGTGLLMIRDVTISAITSATTVSPTTTATAFMLRSIQVGAAGGAR